jgi:hypothetical protein
MLLNVLAFLVLFSLSEIVQQLEHGMHLFQLSPVVSGHVSPWAAFLAAVLERSLRHEALSFLLPIISSYDTIKSQTLFVVDKC